MTEREPMVRTPEIEKPRAVVVLSGGMDSATALYYAINQGYDVSTVSFFYGQRHNKELDFAKKLADRAGVSNVRVDLSPIQDLINRSALTGNIEVPEGHYAADNMKATVVPNRNMIMSSIAIGYAVNIDASRVVLGVHTGDHAVYPDCRPDFVYALNLAARLGNEGFAPKDFQVEAPFVMMGKHDIARLGGQLGVPFEDTWSCYKGGENHCGMCGTCVERKEAFRLGEVKDPTVYEDTTPDYEIPKPESR